MLARNAIPVLHSCAAMLKIAEMEYSGANSIFIRLDKLTSLLSYELMKQSHVSVHLDTSR